MAEESKATSQRVYRRKPADKAEAKFIASLISKFVNESTKMLAEEGRHDELYTVLGYQRDWNGIVKDLDEGDPQAERPLVASDVPRSTTRHAGEVVRRSSPHAHTGSAVIAGYEATEATDDATAGGGTPRSSRARTNTA